jgi:hypothetical protein
MAESELRVLASLDDIVKAVDRRVIELPVKNVGVFYLKEMSAREREAMVDIMFSGDKGKEVPPDRWTLANIAATLCTPAGERFYGNGNGLSFNDLLTRFADDGVFSPKVARRLSSFVMNMNGLGASEDEAIKNSDGVPVSSSS